MVQVVEHLPIKDKTSIPKKKKKRQKLSTNDKAVFLWICPHLYCRCSAPSNSSQVFEESMTGSCVHPETRTHGASIPCLSHSHVSVSALRGSPPHVQEWLTLLLLGAHQCLQQGPAGLTRLTSSKLAQNDLFSEFPACSYPRGHCYLPEPGCDFLFLFFAFGRKER
jgi:hypothetical protein